MLGISGMKKFYSQAVADHPEIKNITGTRISGARTGGTYGGPGGGPMDIPLSDKFIEKALSGGPSMRGMELQEILKALREGQRPWSPVEHDEINSNPTWLDDILTRGQ
jgi:hypothetical protein